MTTRADRATVLAFRAGTNHLGARLPAGSLVQAAGAGLQDSSPRSAVLALHARVEGVRFGDWDDPVFVQVWGPRGAVYVVAAADVAVFTLGLLPRDAARRARLDAIVDAIVDAGPDALATVDQHDVRAASATGRIRIRWDGRDTAVRVVAPPPGDAEGVRLELARRFLHNVGPSTRDGFRWWSGVTPDDAAATWEAMAGELTEVETEGRRAWLLAADEAALGRAAPVTGVRLLPPGDPYLGAADRDLVAGRDEVRRAVWPHKGVWPGAVLADGELIGTWRRQRRRVVITTWAEPAADVREAVEAEALGLPIEGGRASVELSARG